MYGIFHINKKKIFMCLQKSTAENKKKTFVGLKGGVDYFKNHRLMLAHSL